MSPDGDLARTALTYLADPIDTTRRLSEQAMDHRPGAGHPLMLGSGGVGVVAFRADIDLAKNPGKGWKFRFKTKGLNDSTIGKLLSQLLGNFLNPGQ